MKRKLLAAVLIFAMLFTCVPTMALAEEAHSHCVCGGSVTAGDHTEHNNETYATVWTTTPSAYVITRNTNIVLEADIDLQDALQIGDGTDTVTVNLCLNGHTLNQAGDTDTDKKGVIVINKNATLNLCDCSQNNTGTITGGTGTPWNNDQQDTNGGAVYIDYHADGSPTFNMYGGIITGNSALSDGGGVCVDNGKFNLYGGEIKNNSALYDGGGVYVDGSFIIHNGEISNNAAGNNGGGVYVDEDKSMTLSGIVKIFANENNNVYLELDYNEPDEKGMIEIAEAGLEAGSKIGVRLEKGADTFGAFTTNAAAQYAEYFFSDNSNYAVGADSDGKLKLGTPYTLTVENGDGSGVFSDGAVVTITADASDAKGHPFVNWITSSQVSFADVNSASTSLTMPAGDVTVTANYAGHTEVIDQAVAATCTKTGLTEGKHCSVCNTVLVAQQVVDALGHDLGNDNTCDVCGYTKPSTGGGFSGSYNYPVVVADTDGAKVTLSEEHAIAGEKVTITVTPESGMQVDEVIVIDEDGEVIAVSKVGDNTYTFTMPKGKVNVAVTTEAIDYDNKIVLQIGNTNVVVDGKPLANDVASLLQGDRTLVPIRVIIEALGGEVDWNEAARTVTITIDGKVLTLVIDEEIPGFGQGAAIMDNRTYVPIRYVAEYVGAHVEWIAESQQIVILK